MTGKANAQVKVELVWEEPAVTIKNTDVLIAEALEQVKSRPGEWARIAVWGGISGAYSARRRIAEKDPPLVPGRFEYEARRLEGGGSALYARYTARS